MRKSFFCLAGALFFSSLVSHEKAPQLEKCLTECYGIDALTSGQIVEKFAPLLEKREHDSLLDLFMEESKKLDIYSALPGSLEEGPSPYHRVLFENDYVRVSWAVTRSGEQEPPQRHPWKTVMVVIQSSRFYSQQEDGVTYEDDWPVGVYLLDPSPGLLSCKNIGLDEFSGLIFEIKVSNSS